MKNSLLWLGIRSYESKQEAIFNACHELGKYRTFKPLLALK
ncbi:hypothetical protein [Bartonella raoultii]|nr:hypothetical protein [Bartonella raoultii]